MRFITAPPWRVASMRDLDPEEREAAGLVILSGPPRNGTVIADCRNPYLPIEQQRANCALLGKSVAMAEALIKLEERVGDLQTSREADAIYQIVVDCLRGIGIEARDAHAGHDE